MNLQRAAEIQVVLEGIRLPASRDELVRYAALHDAEAAVELERVEDRTFESIDEVGESLVHTEPNSLTSSTLPHAESGEPPGKSDYVNPDPTPGELRPDE